MFEYVFMQRGLMVGVLLGAVIPLIGVTVVLRRLSMIGDALSHTSLAGVAGGFIAGISPVVGAVVACLAGALCVEGVRRRFKEQSELAVAIVMAAGIGLAGVLSGFVPNSSSFNSFMFGSILTVSAQETHIIMAISVLAVMMCVSCALTVKMLPNIKLLKLDEFGTNPESTPARPMPAAITMPTASSL